MHFPAPNCGAPFPQSGLGRVWIELQSQRRCVGCLFCIFSFQISAKSYPCAHQGLRDRGQFGIGVINTAQFGVGFFSLWPVSPVRSMHRANLICFLDRASGCTAYGYVAICGKNLFNVRKLRNSWYTKEDRHDIRRNPDHRHRAAGF